MMNNMNAIKINEEELDRVVGGRTYVTVKKGDTLIRLANRYHTTVAKLMRWNPIIKNRNLIVIGWTLRVA